jgi:membrane protein implicated in regulation of membrane protease activity
MAHVGAGEEFALTWFLVIGGIGVVLLLVSLVGGDLLDGVDLGGDLFSGAALAGFLGAFGFAGALASGAAGTGVGIVAGLVSGVVVGGLVGYATARLRRGGDEATVRSADLAGHDGTVISAIPEGGLGEVSVVIAGHITKLNARASTALPSGTPVTVSAVLSATSVMVQPRA